MICAWSRVMPLPRLARRVPVERVRGRAWSDPHETPCDIHLNKTSASMWRAGTQLCKVCSAWSASYARHIRFTYGDCKWSFQWVNDYCYKYLLSKYLVMRYPGSCKKLVQNI